MRAPLFLSATELHGLLSPLSALAGELARAFRELSRGAATHSARHVLGVEGGALGAMLGAGPGLLGAKVVAVLPGNKARGLNPHQGLVLLLDPETGLPLALGDGAAITALRTAAASLLATRLLAREDSRVLTVVGTGLQAELHVRAMREAREIREVRVVGRDEEKARELARKIGGAMVFRDVKEALPGTDILCLCTSASEPYLRSAQLPDGIHVNAIGACRPGVKEIELDPADARLTFFVESRQAAREEAEELAPAFAQRRDIAELGHLILGEAPGRAHARQITFYKGVGIGLEDLCALRLALRNHQGAPR